MTRFFEHRTVADRHNTQHILWIDSDNTVIDERKIEDSEMRLKEQVYINDFAKIQAGKSKQKSKHHLDRDPSTELLLVSDTSALSCYICKLPEPQPQQIIIF